MKKVITQNDLMMFITENNLMDEYYNEIDLYIFFVFKDESCSHKVGLSSFMDTKPTDCNYEYTGFETFKDRSGDRIVEFYFKKI